jgi:hypothetical protein
LAFPAIVVAGGLFAGAAAADECSGSLKKLSECATTAAGDVTVGAKGCEQVYADKPQSFGTITVAPTGLLCVRDKDLSGNGLTIRAKQIVVHGTLEIGSAAEPIGAANPASHVEIHFTGLVPEVDDSKTPVRMDAPCPDPDFRKGLQVCPQGTLRLFGAEGAVAAGSARHDAAGHVSWTYLSQSAGDPCRFGPKSGLGSVVTAETCRFPDTGPVDGKVLRLADAVDWRPGDWIVVGTTSFSPFETEFARIREIDPTRTVITLDDPLVYDHFGGADPGTPSADNFHADRNTNWGVDERAEVGLISRNVTLTSDMNGSPEDHGGGETIYRAGFKEVSVQGVEFSLLGKPHLGSYPIHFHMVGSISPGTVLMNANSVHHSFNKCLTVHSTQHLLVQNMVCARAVGHLFYEEIGDEDDITFANNLGLGAMSNNFDIHAQKMFSLRSSLIEQYWWPGDRLARRYGFGNYFGFNVGNHDHQNNPTHGSCRTPLPNGGLGGYGGTSPCLAKYYFEPPTGFWIVNPATNLIGNSIGGCQGVGRAYWYVPPTTPGDSGKPDLVNLKFRPTGTFQNNRAHSCYSGLYAEPEDTVVSEQLLPHQNGALGGPSVFNTVDGMTVTRMRDRGIWLRPSFWVVKNARLATNRDSVSLVTAGGVDGTAPGNWALLEDSVLLGISLNNNDRFGPCPYRGATGPADSGGKLGCIDQTPSDPGVAPVGGDDTGRGYPDPSRNFFGLMIYDGPGRYFGDRFVNFNVNLMPYLANTDQEALAWYSSNYGNPLAPPGKNAAGTFVYEGDAALGWFNANQSSYPNTQASEALSFENVDLRHQIYTDHVGIDTFNDGDKNTLILDRDGTLTGMKVVGPDKKSPIGNVFPASLNNLPFNAVPNSVDECLSAGAQNALLENRPTSLISPSVMATLEVASLFPVAPQVGNNPDRYEQYLTFHKTLPQDYPPPVNTITGDMRLHGRNGLGVWEPKVANEYGYTVKATDPYTSPGMKPAPGDKNVGIPSNFNVGLTDAVLPLDAKTHEALKPFHVRLAVCFTDKNGKHPQFISDPSHTFQVIRGYKAYGSPTSNADTIKDYWRDIPSCKNLDAQNPGNVNGCPAEGVAVNGKCPDGQQPVGDKCPTKTLAPAASLAAWGQDRESWFYDASSGWLYLHVVQPVDNATGPSPTGSCDPAHHPSGVPHECPNTSKIPENYYFCPAGGCIVYGVKLLDASYQPGKSTCPDLTDPEVSDAGSLASLDGAILQREAKAGGVDPKTPADAAPHYAVKDGDAKLCPNPGSAQQPPWGPTPADAPQNQTFQVNYDPKFAVKVEVTNRPGVAPEHLYASAGNLIIAQLDKGVSYKITVENQTVDPKTGQRPVCVTTFTPDGVREKPHFTRSQDGPNCIPPSGGGMIGAGIP